MSAQQTASPDKLASVTPVQGSFSAVYHQPARNIKGVLIVIGEVETVTPGWHPHLVAARPQGINQRDLIVDLKAIQPTEIVPQHVVETEVSLVQRMQQREYDSVTILNAHGPGVELKVTILISENPPAA